MDTSPVSYKRHRFPPQIIGYAVWLYYRFLLSLHLVEEMLLERGVIVFMKRSAVDQTGYVLDEIVQTRRNTKAAKRVLPQLLKT